VVFLFIMKLYAPKCKYRDTVMCRKNRATETERLSEKQTCSTRHICTLYTQTKTAKRQLQIYRKKLNAQFHHCCSVLVAVRQSYSLQSTIVCSPERVKISKRKPITELFTCKCRTLLKRSNSIFARQDTLPSLCICAQENLLSLFVWCRTNRIWS